MARPRITVPYSLMRLTHIAWQLDPGNQGGAERTDGSSEALRAAFPAWQGAIQAVLRGDTAAQWAGLVAAARGRQAVLRVPMLDPIGSAGVTAPEALTFDADVTFDDDTAFEAGAVLTVAQAAARGDRQMVVSGTPTLRVGQIVSRNDWPHRVAAVRSELGNTRLTLEPALWEGWAVGAQVDLNPTGLFTLTEDLGGQYGYTLGLTARPALDLRQWIAR
jgi:hypothetical protein